MSIIQLSEDNVSKSTSSIEPLTAWLNDQSRWKELFSIINTEDFSIESSSKIQTTSSPLPTQNSPNISGGYHPQTPSLSPDSTPGNDPKRKNNKSKKPLLLYFPFHNQTDISAGYRACCLFNRWLRFPHKIDLFHLAVSHISKLDLIIRASFSEHFYLRFFLPMLHRYFKIEEGDEWNKTEGTTTKTTATTLHNMTDEQISNFLKVMGDSALVQDFFRSVLDLLDFLEEGVNQFSGQRSRALSDLLYNEPQDTDPVPDTTSGDDEVFYTI